MCRKEQCPSLDAIIQNMTTIVAIITPRLSQCLDIHAAERKHFVAYGP